LKYLILNIHDTNISNVLRFLTYWNTYGYEKYTSFSSSIRFEIIKQSSESEVDSFFIKMTYDD